MCSGLLDVLGSEVGTPSLEVPSNLIVSVTEDRKHGLQGKMHSLLIYFRSGEMVFYITAAVCVLLTMQNCPIHLVLLCAEAT